MNTLAPSFLNQSSSFLQVTRTCMKAWMSSNFGQIPTPTPEQGWDEYCPAGKFQWKMPENSGMANTPKITEVANTGIYE